MDLTENEIIGTAGLLRRELAGMGIPFRRNGAEGLVSFTCAVKNAQIPFEIELVEAGSETGIFFSAYLPFRVPDDRFGPFLVLLCAVNNRLEEGCFKLDAETGALRFYLAERVLERCAEPGYFRRQIECVCALIGEYLDPLWTFRQGQIGLDGFLQLTDLLS